MPEMNTLERVYAIFDAIIPNEHGCQIYGKRLMYHPTVAVEGRPQRASRVVLERKLGRPIKPGYCALHHCDRPPCVNPDHIYEGTHFDNQLDRRHAELRRSAGLGESRA